MESKKTFKNGYGTFSGVSDLFSSKKAAEATTTPISSSANGPHEERPPSPNPEAAADNSAPTKPAGFFSLPLSRKAWILLIAIMFSAVALAVGLLAGLLTRGGHAQNTAGRPNIVFIMADDQDRLLNSTDYMPALQREIFAKGTEFTHHYTTMALCCPSRSALLRGQQVHNTNITNVVAPGYVPDTRHTITQKGRGREAGTNRYILSTVAHITNGSSQARIKTICRIG